MYVKNDYFFTFLMTLVSLLTFWFFYKLKSKRKIISLFQRILGEKKNLATPKGKQLLVKDQQR